MMGMTMVEQILARHADVDRIQPGDIVVCDIDMVVQTDIGFIANDEVVTPLHVEDPDRVAIVLDHRTPAKTVEDATAHVSARKFAARWGIDKFYDVGNHGICHQLIQERALALPGEIMVCSDSHALASGALNCAATGLGALDITHAIATGKSWFRCSPTVKFVLEGTKPANVAGKDILLYMADRFGSQEGHSLEFAGPGLRSLTMDQRSSLATMCTELSADFATFPADQTTLAYLAKRTTRAFTPVAPDHDADYAAVHTIDLSQIRPFVARPDYIPNNTMPLATLSERIAIDQAFVGSCANGKLEDLRTAASILKGKHIAAGVRLIVTPASQEVYLDAVRAGYIATLVEAGAVVTNSTCGACAGGHMGVLAAGEVCITSSTRNFRGRMGSAQARIYMGSTATVAASALAGYITDPTPYMQDGETT